MLSSIEGLKVTLWKKNPADSDDCSADNDYSDSESDNNNDATSNEAEDENYLWFGNWEKKLIKRLWEKIKDQKFKINIEATKCDNFW